MFDAKCDISTSSSKPSYITSCNQWYLTGSLLQITVSFCPTENATFDPTVNPTVQPTAEFYELSTTSLTENTTNAAQITIITTDESFNSDITHNCNICYSNSDWIYQSFLLFRYIISYCSEFYGSIK